MQLVKERSVYSLLVPGMERNLWLRNRRQIMYHSVLPSYKKIVNICHMHSSCSMLECLLCMGSHGFGALGLLHGQVKTKDHSFQI
jgi:hypothetical protein